MTIRTRHVVKFFALVALVVAAPPLLAHAVGLSCKLLDKIVRVEAYFSDDTPAMEALIVVKNEREEIVVQGRTDDKGVWSFDRPAAGRYEVSVDAGAGHRAKQVLTVPALAIEPGGPDATSGAGPTREDFTRVPWLRLAAGLAIIFALAGCWRLYKRNHETH